jgi:hypothetical protein
VQGWVRDDGDIKLVRNKNLDFNSLKIINQSMNMKKLRRFVFINIIMIFVVLAGGQAQAASSHDEPMAIVNNSFAVNFTTLHLYYSESPQEINPNIPGDANDFGWMYGVAFNLRNVFFEMLYTDLTGEFAYADIEYQGYKQKTFEPLNTSVTNEILNVDAKLGLILLDTEYLQIIPYGGIGFRYWRRFTAYNYIYYNFKPIVGVKLNLGFFDDLVLSPYVNFGTILGAQASARVLDNITLQEIGTVNHQLKNKLFSEYGLEINYRLTEDLLFVASASYTQFKFGKSVAQVINGQLSQEPNSKTDELRFSIGMRYSFM